MTKKDYIKIADSLVQIYRHGHFNENQEKLILEEFAEMFQADNYRFQTGKFVNYINKKLGR